MSLHSILSQAMYILLLCISRLMLTNSENPFGEQPSIRVENGHLIFQTAENRNISFISIGTGSFTLNNKNLIRTLNLATSYIDEIKKLKLSHLDILSTALQNLHYPVESIPNAISSIEQLEHNVSSLSNQVTQLIENNEPGSVGPRGVRRLTRRVQNLEDEIQQITSRLSRDECSSSPCRNGGTCVNTLTGYHCLCPSTWEGTMCEDDVNECANFIGTTLGCQNGATCINTQGDYRCQCPPNWFGLHCTEQHNDCNSASHHELCGHGTCIDVPRSDLGQPKYRCICDQGWKTNDFNPACVVDIDECASGHPSCSRIPLVTCINLPGTFRCGPCPPGYSGNGYICNDIDECQVNNGGCSTYPHVQCINTLGSRVCGGCPPGYVGDGTHCTFTGVCHNNNGGCHPMATCIENSAISGSFRECRCPSSYRGNGIGFNGCLPATGTACASNPCINGNCQDLVTTFRCICMTGYTGTLCDTAIDLCASSPCRNGGTCSNQHNAYTCLCPTDWQGTTCEEPKESCGGHFTEESGSFRYPGGSEQQYPDLKSCVWIITVQDGKAVSLSFPSFHLEYSEDCSYDFLQLNDGPTASSHLVGKFCGVTPPGTNGSWISSHNSVYLLFHSDHSVRGDGFVLIWNATDPVCGGDLQPANYGNINSPGYPGKYPVFRDCYWTVRVPLGKRIQFHFATLQLERSSENCTFDFLQIKNGIRDNDPILDTYCGRVTPPPLLTSGSFAQLHFHSDESGTDNGFHITYAAVPGIHGCGGTLTAPSGAFSSPNFPVSYESRLECDWLIRIHPDDRIQLTFTHFDLERHYRCQWDYVQIHDGKDENSPILGRYCNYIIPPVVLSQSNQLFIKFVTDWSVTRTGFRAEYHTVCGGIYTGLDGVVHSPYYPDAYPAACTCIYIFRLTRGYILNLVFYHFNVEPASNCQYDSLEIRDGDTETSPLLETLCGHALPQPVTSSYNVLWMKFTTDGSVQNTGFYANFTSLNVGCGGVYTEDHGSISTPRHPFYYPDSAICTWLIRAPEGYIIRLTFHTFSLEQITNCAYDYVEIVDTTGVTIGRFCGSNSPPVLTSTGNQLIVKFISDESVMREGFSSTYAFFDASQVCGGEFFMETGVITSPRFPENYPHNKQCTWVLHAENGHQIMLNVTDFHLENHTNCNFDYLEIRNGGTASSPLIGKYCGVNINNPITSHSHTVWLSFRSDSSLSAPGFRIFYDETSSGCGGRLTSPTGSIVSPNYPLPYGHNADCTWLIRLSRGSLISITVVDVDIESHQTCEYDSLEIYDGKSESSSRLARLCNNQQNPGTLTSSKNSIFIKFRTDYSQSGRGFHLAYHLICRSLLTSRRGVIESPNFPNPYPHNHNCSWTIKAPVGNNITLAFSHLYLEGGNCENDYLEVLQKGSSETPHQLRKFCGSPTPLPTIETTENMAIVNFITDSSVSRDGFRLEWHFKGCGGDLRKPHTYFTSPNYPNGYPLKTSCLWHISTVPGRRVELHIVDFDLESDPNCMFDFVKVYSGQDESSPLLATLCHRESGDHIIPSTGNHMLVHFYSDVSIEGKGFKAYFTSILGGCGGKYTVSRGNISSPNYPSTTNIDCEWIISLSQFHLVELIFDVFDFSDSPNCTAGYLEIHDGDNIRAPRLLKHCGNEIPQAVTSTGNLLYLHMKSTEHTFRGRFFAHYESVCGARIKADNGGTLTSPNYPHGSMNHFNCSWILYSLDSAQKVTLIFTYIATYPSSNCSNSYVEVRDGQSNDSPILKKFCGFHVPPPITSQSSALHVYMHSFSVFRATFSVSSSACGGTLTSLSGAFNSPDYPNSYPTNTECIWIIQSPPGNLVQLTFSYFDIESSDFCNMDYLEIRQDSTGGGPLLGRYCGNELPTNISIVNTIWVKFRSDAGGEAPGFMAQYSLAHGVDLTGPTGEIASPSYPHVNFQEGEYAWRVLVPEHMFISIQFLEIDIGLGPSHDCATTYVQIFDGYDTNFPSLGKFCGRSLPEIIISHTSTVTIVYLGSQYYYSLWRLRWTAVNETVLATPPPQTLTGICGEEIFLNTTNPSTFQSPGYPFGYDRNLNCTWIFKTLESRHINLEINNLNIEGRNGSCLYDMVKVYDALVPNADSWNLLSTLCGRVNDYSLSSTSNMLKVTFTTDYFFNRTGFIASASSACGGKLIGITGRISSDDTTDNMRTCEWIISVRPGRTIQVTFQSFNLYSEDSVCSLGYLLIRNGGHSSSPILGKYCGTVIPVLQESSSNQLYIKLNNPYRHQLNFVMEYHEISIGCGETLYLGSSNPVIEVQSPSYPSPPPHNIECNWVIMSPEERRIRVDFENEFDMESGCQGGEGKEFVQIFDGGTVNAESLGIFCGSRRQPSVLSTGDVILIRYVTSAENPRSGFKANITAAECGGTVSSYYGHVTSPNFPGNYSNNQECEWLIVIHGYNSLNLNIKRIELPSSDNCTNGDYLEIRDLNATGEILGRFCGSQSPSPIMSIRGVVYVKFKSDASMTGSGFDIYYRPSYSRCGGDLRTPTGVITSPNFPAAYPNFRYCRWNIFVQSDRRIKLTFTSLNLPRNPITGNCEDAIRIVNGSMYGYALHYITVCDSTIPQPIESYSNMLCVIFLTNGLAAGEGFSLSYTSDNEARCGGQLPFPSGRFSTPWLEGNYSTQFECLWTLSTSSDGRSNHTTVLKFDYFDIPGKVEENCRSALVTVGISHAETFFRRSFFGRQLTPICGNLTHHTPVITVPHPYVQLRYFSFLNYGGFNGSYRIQECGGLVEGDANLTSPGYPENYPPSSECHWIVNIPEGEQINLTAIHFQLESNCDRDYILVRNGRMPNSPLIGRFCGTNFQGVISQSNYLTVVFHSDTEGSASGFLLKASPITSGCGGIFHRRSGTIVSPNYPHQYANNIECEWIIEVQPGFRVKLNFVGRFDIEMHGTCDHDYIKVEDFIDGTWKVLNTLCGATSPESIISNSNKLKLTFHSNNDIQADGFQVEYSDKCGSSFNDDEGFITSPDFPRNYPGNLHCEYLIQPRTGQYIGLVFTDFDLEASGDGECRFDSLTVYQGNTTSARSLNKYCGDETPGPFSSETAMLVVFSTDFSVGKKGFRAKYIVSDCGGHLNNPTGEFHSPAHPSTYMHNLDCTWFITVEPNRVVELKFLQFDIEASYTCYYDYVEIRDGNNATSSPSIGRFCGKSPPPVIKSSGNSMVVHFHSDFIISGAGFRAAYRTTFGELQGCGGPKFAASGTIHSLDIDGDGKYEPNIDCIWHIIAAANKVVRFEFQNMDIEESPNSTCAYDYVEVRDGLSETDSLMFRYCGQTLPSPMVASSNKLLVHFHADDQGNGNGFQATFNSQDSICGGLLTATNVSEALSAPFVAEVNVRKRCVWHITSSSTDKFKVEFSDFKIPCGEGYLEFFTTHIYVPTSPHRYCGQTVPHEILATNLMVTFATCRDEVQCNFTMSYMITNCSQSYYRDNSVILSPQYPSYYPREKECKSKIEVAAGHTIALYFLQFTTSWNMENRDCSNGRLNIRDGNNASAPLIASECGSTQPNPVFSTGNSLWLHTQINRSCRYFISYTSTDKGSGCGGNLTHMNGSFTSPRYPLPYNIATECRWYLRVPGSHSMTLSFRFFSLSSVIGCSTNYLEVYESHEELPTNLITRFCGNDNPAPVTSQTSALMVKLVTSTNNTEPGFNAVFQMKSHVETSSRFVFQATSPSTVDTTPPETLDMDDEY